MLYSFIIKILNLFVIFNEYIVLNNYLKRRLIDRLKYGTQRVILDV